MSLARLFMARSIALRKRAATQPAIEKYPIRNRYGTTLAIAGFCAATGPTSAMTAARHTGPSASCRMGLWAAAVAGIPILGRCVPYGVRVACPAYYQWVVTIATAGTGGAGVIIVGPTKATRGIMAGIMAWTNCDD